MDKKGDKIKQISLTYIVESIKKGKNPSDIAKELNTSKQRINYYVAKLKAKGLLIKRGFAWEIDPIEQSKNLSHATNLNIKEIRGHAFVWKVQARKLKSVNWKQILTEKNIQFEEMGIQNTPRIIINNKKVWLGQKNIIIYEPQGKSFFGVNAIESRKLAVYSLLETLRALEKLLGTQIKDFRFTPNREHYSMIKNALAVQCNKNNEKINVFNEKGLWLSIDDSLQLGELETLGSMENKPMDTNVKVQKWWNDNKATDFKVTPSFILDALNKSTEQGMQNTKNLGEYAIHLKSHVESVQILASQVKNFVEEIKGLKEIIKELKK